MTGERAVEVITEMLNEGDILGDVRLTDERVEALEFAAEALERPQGDYEAACNVLMTLENLVRISKGWDDEAVQAVHDAIQLAIKCMGGDKA